MYDKRTVRALALAVMASVPFLLLDGLIAHPDADAAATPAPANKSSPVTAPVRIETLKPAQLTSMPGTTIVILRTGRKVSLDVLRNEHSARLARFAKAATLGKQVRVKLVVGGRGPKTAPAPASTPVTMTLNPHGAADYQAFCQAAAASGCLYFPGPATLLAPMSGQDPNLVFDYDPLVTDPAACSSQGGIIENTGASAGCAYGYPYTYKGSFNPGPPVPGQGIGSGVTTTQTCTAPTSATVDPKGAIQMAGNFMSSSGASGTTTATLTCIVQVSIASAAAPSASQPSTSGPSSCGLGERWIIQTQSCLAVQPTTSGPCQDAVHWAFDPVANKCVALQACPSKNQIYDPNRKRCVPLPPGGQTVLQCLDGWKFDLKQDKCVQPTCASPLVFSNDKGKCVPTPPTDSSLTPPPGSYTKSCANAQYDPASGVLSAICQTARGPWTVGLHLHACKPGGDIVNRNGWMLCEARAGTWGDGMAVPNGHYLYSCQPAWVLPYSLPANLGYGGDHPAIVNGVTVAHALYARCTDDNGNWQNLFLDLKDCIMGKDITVFHGNLACNGTRPLPPWFLH
jgi:hypothetical protein